MPTNIFEYAARHKLRFASSRGDLTTEQLWDLPLLSPNGFDLNNVAKAANQTLKGLTEESFVNTGKTDATVRAETALEVVKHVIAVKIADAETAKKRGENKAKKDRLLQILAEKQAGALTALSEKELQDQIAALDT